MSRRLVCIGGWWVSEANVPQRLVGVVARGG